MSKVKEWMKMSTTFVNLEDTTRTLGEGYCLWIGAGVTTHIAPKKEHIPGWPLLTELMEKDADLPQGSGHNYPTRLQMCYDRLGRKKYRRFLRETYYTQLCIDLLEEAENLIHRGDFIPQRVRQVAMLGQLANPIINFNIEPFSSMLLARPAGPIRIIPHVDARTAHWLVVNRELYDRFARIVYHPHGLSTGDTIMTESQYRDLHLTLAYELAIHAAFGNNLAIVGKGLDAIVGTGFDDSYLCQQIRNYRREIKNIIWFVNIQTVEKFLDCYPEALDWFNKNQVQLALFHNYEAFWHHWTKLSISLNEADLFGAWYQVLEEASLEVRGGALTELSRSLANIHPYLARQLQARGEELEEPGTPQHTIKIKPHTIVLKVKERIEDAGMKLPQTASLDQLGNMSPDL